MSTHRDGPIHDKAPLDLVIRHTCANVAIVLVKTHNNQVELQELRKELRDLEARYAETLAMILQFLDNSESRQHAEAVIKEFSINKGKPTK